MYNYIFRLSVHAMYILEKHIPIVTHVEDEKLRKLSTQAKKERTFHLYHDGMTYYYMWRRNFDNRN